MIDIRNMLEAAGVQITHEGSREIHGRCPMHRQRTGKDDRHPSWSVSKRKYVHRCWSCGYTGSLYSLLIDLTGAAPEDLEQKLHEESFMRAMSAEDFQQARRDPEPIEAPILTPWVLDNIFIDLPYKLMALRYLKQTALAAYRVRWDPQNRQTVLPLWDTQGHLLGAQYRQKGSVFTLPTGMEKSRTIFGYEQVKPFDTAVCVESPLDAVRLFGLGIPAFSCLGAWVSREQVAIMARLFSHVVLALDDDKAGHDAEAIVIPMLKKLGCPVVKWDYTGLTDDEGEPAKDVGDVPDDDAILTAWDRTTRMGF
jgi:hypothetical protein